MPRIGTPPRADLGAIIAAEIAGQGATVGALAVAAGLHPQRIHDAIEGTDPRLSTLLAILGALGRDLQWIHEQGVTPR